MQQAIASLRPFEIRNVHPGALLCRPMTSRPEMTTRQASTTPRRFGSIGGDRKQPAMPIALLSDLDLPNLPAETHKANNVGRARRLPAPAPIYDGRTRTETAEIGRVTLRFVRD
jgi:hypothetical protein